MRERLVELRGRIRALVEPRLRPAVSWYQGREPREKKVLMLLVGAVAGILLYLLVWQPAWDLRHSRIRQWQSNSQLLSWMQGNAEQIRALRAGGEAASAPMAGDWTASLTRSAAAAGLTLKSVNAEGSEAVRIQLEDQPFAEALAWVGALAAQGVEVVSAEFVPSTAPGRVNLRATLRRAA